MLRPLTSESTRRDSPRPPLEAWPVQHYDRSFGFAWYCGRGLIVSQSAITNGGAEPSHAYHDFEESMLGEHAEEIRAHGGLFVIHDWRTLLDHDPSGRSAWQQRMSSRPKGYLRGSVVCLVTASPLLHMAVHTVNLYTSTIHGVRIELTTDIEGALRKHGLIGP